MYALSESALDRHFQSQMRVMGDIYTHNIGESDQLISQRWLELFQLVRNRQDKYARNCLMLLMYSQLRELGRLGKPFTDLENIRRNLDDVLSEYDGQMNDDDDEVGDADTNAYDSGGDTDSADEKRSARMSAGGSVGSAPVSPEYELSELTNEQNEEFNSRFQANQHLLQEIDTLHASTLENEMKYKATELSLKSRVEQHAVDLNKESSEALSLMVNRCAINAIGRLKSWTGAEDHINFLSTCLQHVLHDKPELHGQIMKLDRQFECVLDNMVDQACDRRQMNVCQLYEQLFKEQKDQLRQREQMLAEQQQQLQLHATELKQREEMLRQREVSVQLNDADRAAGGRCTPTAKRSQPAQAQQPCCYARQRQQQYTTEPSDAGTLYQPVGAQPQAQCAATNGPSRHCSCNGTPPTKNVLQLFYEQRTSCGQCQATQSTKKIIEKEYRELPRGTQ